MPQLLTDRVAIITGASKGIGRVMCQLFAREGAKVICAARSEGLVRETASLINSAGGAAVAVVADASSEAGAKAIIDAGLRAFNRIDTLVNNAGDGGPTKAVQDYSIDDWYYTVNSCLTRSYLCIRFAVPAMIAAGGGAIVNIASMAGRRGLAYRIGYCSAKAGQSSYQCSASWNHLERKLARSACQLPQRWPMRPMHSAMPGTG